MPIGVYQHKPLSEEAKKNLSLFWKGKKKPESQCINMGKAKTGNKHPLFGVSPSKETLLLRSLALKGKPAWNKGKKCPQLATNWKGGITPINVRIRHSIEFRLWREAVFARDNWTCQKCKVRGNILHPHHIKSFSKYPELRFAIDNGITLCKVCHEELHRILRRLRWKL
jgi:hypothetical protein